MKRFDVKSEKVINGNTFLVRPFGAFVAANISGELIAILTPIIASIAPAFANATVSGTDVLDVELDGVLPSLSGALSSISGDKLEPLLKKLLTKHGNISVQVEGESDVQPLTEDLADELFCGEMQDMFILAFEVIKANYSGFFKNLAGDRFGNLLGRFREVTGSTSPNTESSTTASSPS